MNQSENNNNGNNESIENDGIDDYEYDKIVDNEFSCHDSIDKYDGLDKDKFDGIYLDTDKYESE